MKNSQHQGTGIAYPLDLATTNSSPTALGLVAALVVPVGAGLKKEIG